MFSAARNGDPISHDSIAPSGFVGSPSTGPCPPGITGPVMIEMVPAAHVGYAVVPFGKEEEPILCDTYIPGRSLANKEII